MVSKIIADLVRRQAAILSEIDRLDETELNSLANLAVGRDRVSSERAARACITIETDITERPVTVPALPGFFLLDLIRLPDGGFHPDRVLKTPVIARRIDASSYPEPVIPGPQVFHQWAVLMPDGTVVCDDTSNLFGEFPVPLKEWVRAQIDFLQDPINAEFPFKRPVGTAVQ